MLSDPNGFDGPSEHSRLLDECVEGQHAKQSSAGLNRVLPLALVASIGVHMTAASTVFVYASLFCAHPERCADGEKQQFAGSVATATALANVAGLVSLGYLERLIQASTRAGLTVWFACRGLGVLGLVAGVYLRSFPCALGGQVLQGLASDNLLHFNLNSIYTSAQSTDAVSTLMGASLALYMLGMAAGPAAAAVLPSFEYAFIAAAGMFGFAILYVVVALARIKVEPNAPTESPRQPDSTVSSSSTPPMDKRSSFQAVLSPARLFYEHPRAIPQGLSLFLYNVVQAYLINLIFVFASVQFNFTVRENGILLTLIATVAASYLLLSLFVVPRLLAWFNRFPRLNTTETASSGSHRGRELDLVAASLSILIQTLAAIFLSQIRQPGLLYAAAALTALGLAAPSFIKSYFVAALPNNASQGVSALALMETSGGLLSPLVLGGWQARHADSTVFYFAAGMLAASLVCLVGGAYVHRR
ncbi:hypothetical protein BJX96DRAFT_178690 [Aspergillus floccosus]